MANYYGHARSNYVTVTDLAGLTKALEPWPIEIVANQQGQVAFLAEDPDGAGWPTYALDDDGNELELDVATVIMPFVAEEEVLVIQEAGAEKLRYVVGVATAYVRRGQDVQHTQLSIDDIYARASEQFGVPDNVISRAVY